MKRNTILAVFVAAALCGCGTVRQAVNEMNGAILKVIDTAEAIQTNMVNSASGLAKQPSAPAPAASTH